MPTKAYIFIFMMMSLFSAPKQTYSHFPHKIDRIEKARKTEIFSVSNCGISMSSC